MSSEIVKFNPALELRECKGDVSRFTDIQRKQLYIELCRAYGFDPLSFPFDYIKDKGNLKIYVNSVGASLLRHKYQVSLKIKSREFHQDMWIVTCIAVRGNREEEATGAVAVGGYVNKVNALKKAETQAKRRATLSICGWGWDDEESGTILKAELSDPPQQMLPPEKQPDVWRIWESPKDAISWAMTELPDYSQEELEAEFIALGEGKKAPRWVRKVNELKVRF